MTIKAKTGKHTPGPWIVSTSDRYVRYGGIHGPNICDLEVFGGPRDENEANARLISAAPDLLKTLQETQQTLLGVSSYLATCEPATIMQNLDSLITSLRISLAIVATAIQRAKGESL